MDEDITSYLKKQYALVYDLKILRRKYVRRSCRILEGLQENVGHCKEMLEYKNGQVAIHPKHTKLITALRTAVEW